jgi:hypothetical protein
VRYLAAAADETNACNFGAASRALLEPIERVMKWIVRRDRCRFVPPFQCRVIRGYRYADTDGDDDGEGKAHG